MRAGAGFVFRAGSVRVLNKQDKVEWKETLFRFTKLNGMETE
jgi:hypothetical protein